MGQEEVKRLERPFSSPKLRFDLAPCARGFFIAKDGLTLALQSDCHGPQQLVGPVFIHSIGNIMTFSKASAATLFALILASAASSALAYTGEEFAKDAKVTLEQARAIALKAHPGKIVDEELEREKGGSGLRYSFDIRNGKVTQEVGVDAKTGDVLENSPEGPNAD